MKKSIPIREFIFDPEKDEFSAISLVTQPAIEKNFQYFSDEKIKECFSYDEEQHIITGPFLMPDTFIYRSNEGDDFYGFFSKETVETMFYRFMKDKKLSNITLNHENLDLPLEERLVDGVYIIEAWIVKDKNMDKSKLLNIDIKDGTIMTSMKVENMDVWKGIKDGTYQGFSIESFLGIMNSQPEELSLEDKIRHSINSNDLNMFVSLLNKESNEISVDRILEILSENENKK